VIAIVFLCRKCCRVIVKSKSMTTEETHLNAALEAAGMQVVETDLGEYIIQLADEPPSHIIAPAIHKTRGQIADLFTAELGMPPTDDIVQLTGTARTTLRDRFATADMGISGVNFAIAENPDHCRSRPPRIAAAARRTRMWIREAFELVDLAVLADKRDNSSTVARKQHSTEPEFRLRFDPALEFRPARPRPRGRHPNYFGVLAKSGPADPAGPVDPAGPAGPARPDPLPNPLWHTKTPPAT